MTITIDGTDSTDDDVACSCYGCEIRRQRAVIPAPDRSAEACVPPFACANHDSCLTHSEWVDEARCNPPGACVSHGRCETHGKRIGT